MGRAVVQFGLSDDVLPRLLAVLSGNRKRRLITLYGSRAKGTARPGSDIDRCLDGMLSALGSLMNWKQQLIICFFPGKWILQSSNRSTIPI